MKVIFNYCYKCLIKNLQKYFPNNKSIVLDDQNNMTINGKNLTLTFDLRGKLIGASHGKTMD